MRKLKSRKQAVYEKPSGSASMTSFTNKQQDQNSDYFTTSRSTQSSQSFRRYKHARGDDFWCFDDISNVRTKYNSTKKENPGNDTRTKQLRSQTSITKGINMENRISSSGLLATGREENPCRKPLKTSRQILAEKNATDGSNANVTNINKTVTKIYSSRKERSNKKTEKMISDKNSSRLPKSTNAKTYSIVTGCSNKPKVGKPKYLKMNNATDYNTCTDKKNDRDNGMSNTPKRNPTVKRANNLSEDRVLEEDTKENNSPKLSLEDSRVMPSLIQNDTETDSVTLLQTSTDGKTHTEVMVAEERDGGDESENLVEKKFYEGIYFLGDQANKILSYAFSKENRVEPNATILVNGEPTRSEF